jgi:hypothetical protein
MGGIVHLASGKPARPAGERSGLARLCSSVTFCCALLLAGTAKEAKAGFVGYYALSNFTLTNNFESNGYISYSDPNTLVLNGSNSGTGLPGITDLIIAAEATGLFQFSFTYATLNSPTFTDGGYLLAGTFYQIADTNGDAGSVSVPVVAGEIIGFSVTGDNQGEPGILTVTSFSAPTTVPEPGSLRFLLIGAAAATVFRNLRRIRFPRRLNAGIVVVAVAAICFTGPMLAQPQVSYSGLSATGQLLLTTVVNVGTVAGQPAGADKPLQSALAPIELLHAPRPRLRPPTSTMRLHPAIATTGESADTLSASLVAQSLSIVPLSGTSGFNALSHLDQRDANGGNQLSIEPPSPSIAVGNGYVLEGVNDAIQIYNTSGTPALPIVLASNQLFGLAPAINYTVPETYGVYLTDMRVYFDSGTNLWFVLERAQDRDIYGDELETSHLYLAVSQTANPTGNYNIYVMNTTNSTHPGCPCLPDYPQIGSDQYGFHISWDEYSTISSAFVDAAVLSVSKASLSSGAGQPTAFQVIVPYSTGYEFCLQPATTPPGAFNFLADGGLEYFVSTDSPSESPSGVALWAMYNTSSLATSSPNLTLTRIIVPTLAYAIPVAASQRPGSTPLGTAEGARLEYLDGSDYRVLCLTYSTGRLYLTFQTGTTDQNGKFVDGAAYIVLSPTYRSGVLAAQVLNQGYLVVNGNHLLRPAIAVNAQPVPSGAIAVTLVGPDYYPSAALIPFQTFSTPSTIQVAAAGALPEDGFTGYPIVGGDGIARWGDYNTAVAASDGSIWMAVEYIGNFQRTTYANWNTYVMQNQP